MLHPVNPAIFVKKVIKFKNDYYILTTTGKLLPKINTNDQYIEDVIVGKNKHNNKEKLFILNGFLRHIVNDTYTFSSRYSFVFDSLYYNNKKIASFIYPKYHKIGYDIYNEEGSLIIWSNDDTIKIFHKDSIFDTCYLEKFRNMDRSKLFVTAEILDQSTWKSAIIFVFTNIDGCLNIITGGNIYTICEVIKEYAFIDDYVKISRAEIVSYFYPVHNIWTHENKKYYTKDKISVQYNNIYYSFNTFNDRVVFNNCWGDENTSIICYLQTWRDNIDRAGQLYDVVFEFCANIY